MTKHIMIEGAGKGGKQPKEAPDSLFSNNIAHILDCLGEGEIEGLVGDTETERKQSIFYNEVPLIGPNGEVNASGVIVTMNNGTPDQPAMPGFDDVRSTVAVSQELPYNTPKTISFPNDGTVTAVSVTISASNFFSVDKDGNTNGTTCSFTIYRSQNGGTFEPVYNGNIVGKQTDEVTVDYRVPISDPTGITSLRVVRTKADSSSLKVNDAITFKNYTKIVEHKFSYPNLAMVGHIIDAKQFGNAIPTRQYRVRGLKCRIPHNYDPKARTYTGPFNGTLKAGKFYTNNPVWLFLELITNKRFGLGRFFNENLIDIPSLYQTAKWCDELVPDGLGGTEPRWTCNTVINTRGDAFNVLKDLVSCFRGSLFWMQAKLWAFGDQPREPVKIVTNANVIGGKFTYSGESNRHRFSVVNVSWNDPAMMFRRSIESVENPDLIREIGYKTNDFGAFGCSSRAQARRLGNAILFAQEFESELVSYSASFDHMAVAGDGPDGLAPGDLILIADKARGNAVAGGRVKAANGNTIMLDRGAGAGTGTIYIEHADGTVEWVTCNYADQQVAEVDGDKTLAKVTLTENPLHPVAANDLFILIANGYEPEPFVVLKIARSDKHIIDISAVRYDEARFAAIYEDRKVDPTKYMSLPKVDVCQPVSNVTAQDAYITGVDVYQRVINIGWTKSPDPYLSHNVVAYSKDNNDWVDLPVASGNTAQITDARAGNYRIRVTAVNRAGVYSNPVYQNIAIGAVPDDTVLAVGTIEGLQLDGGGATFTGRDAKFTWRVSTPQSDYMEQAGLSNSAAVVGIADPMFRDCVVTVRRSDGTILREESVTDTTYVYSLEKNAQDNGGTPVRSIRLGVQYRDRYGRLSAETQVPAANPAPVLPVQPVASAGLDAIRVDVTNPNDIDFAGIKVYASLNPNVALTDANLRKVTTADNQLYVASLGNQTHYLKVVPYDAFGDGAPSVEISAEPLGVTKKLADLTTSVDDLVEVYGDTASSAYNANAAQTAAANAAGALNDAKAARDAAANAQAAAAASQDAAGLAKSGAEAARTGAETARDASQTAKGLAESANTSAQAAKTAAESAKKQASDAAADALASQGAAATSASTASGFKNDAQSAASAAQASVTAAQSARDLAKGYSDAASTSASGAATSADAAGQKASAAQTSATNAATSAGNANTYAGNAQTSATNAASSASDALGSKNAASTSAGAAASSEGKAAGSATAAGNSATSAATSATNAGNSATAASQSEVTAKTSAANMAPSDFREGGRYFMAQFLGTQVEWPASADNGWTFPLVSGRGPVAQVVTQATGNPAGYHPSRQLTQLSGLPLQAGRKYRSTVVIACTNNPNGDTQRVEFYHLANRLDGVHVGSVKGADYNIPAPNNFYTLTYETTGDALLASTAGGNPGPAAVVKSFVRLIGSNGTTFQIAMLKLEDVTSELAAAGSASAAASSASTADASKTAAGQSASAAQTSATNASTSAGNAQTYANNAASSASGAAGSATTAQQQAGIATTAKTDAQTARDAAAGSASSAAGSASTATSKASDAGQSATSASTSANTASTKAGEAAGSASAAAGSASSAASSSTAAGNSATAAQNASISATSAASSVFPSDFVNNDQFWTTAYTVLGTTGTPDCSYDNVSGIGQVFRTPVDGRNTAIVSKGYITAVVGRRYRITAKARLITASTNSTPARWYLHAFLGYNSAGAYGVGDAPPASETMPTVATGWETKSAEYTVYAGGPIYIRPCVAFNFNGSAGAVWQLAFLKWEDVTSETNAAGSANAAAGSASTASTKATEAGNSATSATGSANTANTKAGEAAGSASAAAGSASAAASSSSAAAQSASSAASSELTAKVGVRETMPSDFREGGRYFMAHFDGPPDNIPLNATTGWTFVNTDEGQVAQTTPTYHDATYSNYPRQVAPAGAGLKVETGRRYRATYKVKVTDNPSQGTQYVRFYFLGQAANNNQHLIGFNYNDYGVPTQGAWYTQTVEINASTMLAGNANIRYVKPFIRLVGPDGATWQVALLKIEDITSEANAAGSASAAASSASAASGSATTAGQQASAAQTSATNAATSAGNAQTYASNASTSASNASGSANTASTAAGNAASARDAANGSAGAAATSASSAAGSATAAGNSATAAASSSLTAQAAAGNMAPATFQEGGRYFMSWFSGTPEASPVTASLGWTFPVVSGQGTVARALTRGDVNGYDNSRQLTQISGLPLKPNRRYRATYVVACPNNAGGGTQRVAFFWLGQGADPGDHRGSIAAPIYNIPDVGPYYTQVLEVNSNDLLNAAPGAAYVKPFVRVLGNGGSTIDFSLLRLEDMTAEANASAQASAASSSAASASASAAVATQQATLSATVAAGLSNYNATFQYWPDGAAVPPGFADGGGGGGGSRVAGLTSGSYGWRLTAAPNNNCIGLFTDAAQLVYVGNWIVLEADIRLDAGTLNGAAFQASDRNSPENAIAFALDKDSTDAVVGSGVVGRTYRFKKVIKLPGSIFGSNCYLVNKFTGTGQYGRLDEGNTITWLRAGIRAATTQEINSGKAGDLSSRITSVEGVAATAAGRTEAYSQKEVVAGSAAAFISFRAKDVNGNYTSDVGIGASTVSLYNQAAGGWKLAMQVAGGNAVFTGGLQAGAFIRLGSGAGWPVALAQRDFLVADDTYIDFGTNLVNIPDFSFARNNFTPLGTNQTYQVYIENPTPTGGTLRAKIITPGSPTNVSLTADYAGGGPTRIMDKGGNPDSTDGNYTLSITGTITGYGYYVNDECVWVEAFLHSGKRAGDAVVGDGVLILHGEDTVVPGEIASIRFGEQMCVRITTVSGITLTASTSTPVDWRDGTKGFVTDALGREMAVMDFGEFRWEEVVSVETVGVLPVALIYAHDVTYAAGDQQGRQIFTHNITQENYYKN